MTDLDSPRKNNDCYFYYYSTCAKGDNCTFRHEPSALGCETTCSFWKEGKCMNVHCNFRHMELRKNRKVIPCYWEAQPGGCLKPHCPFMHATQNAKEKSDSDDFEKTSDSDKLSSGSMASEKLSQTNENNYKTTSVDSLVVNFEEESDSESVPTFSPMKSNQRLVKVKTLEQIRLEKIQAESAAYYSYPGAEKLQEEPDQDSDDLRKRLLQRMETRKRKFQEVNPKLEVPEDDLNTTSKRVKLTEVLLTDADAPKSDFKIKTLTEIRSERLRRFEQKAPDSQCSEPMQETIVESEQIRKRKHTPIVFDLNKKSDDISTNEVTSTSKDENVVTQESFESESSGSPKHKIKLRRILNIKKGTNNLIEQNESTASPIILENIEINNSPTKTEEMKLIDEDVITEKSPAIIERSDSNKTMDEVLLLEDDDDMSNVSIKEEEELLNDIDDLLNE